VLPTASAGAVLMVRRELFLALGGFDDLYLPGRYEDLDLAWRGWRRGWRGLFVPEARALHLGAGTFGPYYGRSIARLDLRNAVLFVWKNLTDRALLVRHFGWLSVRLLRSTVCPGDNFAEAFRQALRRARAALYRRRHLPPPTLSDKELLRLLSPESLIRVSSQSRSKRIGPRSTAEGHVGASYSFTRTATV